MAQSRLAVFSVSAGAGHMRAAEALRTTCEKTYPTVEAVHIDLMTLVGDMFRKMYAESYLSLVENHPSLWGYLYRKADREKTDSLLNRLRRSVEKLNTRQFITKLEELNPDHVICTHFLPAELLSRMIADGTWNKPVWVTVTDFDIHSMWVHSHMNGYFAAADEVKARMIDRGLPAERITVTGIPIMPSFSQALSREECARELGLDPKRVTILMMSGGFGVGGIDKLAERLLGIPGDFQILALAGRNEALLADLKNLATVHPKRLFPIGFTKTVERAMICADLAVTKPGGLSTSECLAMNLPMILVSPIPGQEERNADYLLENGAAMKAIDGAALEFRVRMVLAEPDRLAKMRDRARAIARPLAARQILEKVLGPC